MTGRQRRLHLVIWLALLPALLALLMHAARSRPAPVDQGTIGGPR